jgi:protein involved in polysaccharide export with SLBB domain
MLWLRRLRSVVLVLVPLSLGIAGCETVDPYAANPGPAALVEQYPEIKLSAGDKLRVTVFGEDKLSGDFDLDLNGNASLPLAGTVNLAGQTKQQAEATIARKLRSEYLRSPKVTVDVTSFRPFYVIGQVERPGEFPYRNRLNIISAMAVAGGPTFRASKSKVFIQRGGVGAFEEVELSPSIPVYPGDIIRVPERYF